MRVLFDFVTTQPSIGGAAEYVRSVYYSLISFKKSSHYNIDIIGAYNSSIGRFAYDDLTPRALETECSALVDVGKQSLFEIIQEQRIDKVFIGMAQMWGKYEVASLTCPVVMVVHDICQEEFEANNIVKYLMLSTPRMLFKHILKEKLIGNKALLMMRPYEGLMNRNNFTLIAVSQYTKYSLMNQYSLLPDRIKVLYSPERQMKETDTIENDILRDLVAEKCPYYLVLNANRAIKNVEKTLKAFNAFHSFAPESKIVTVGYPGTSQFANHVVLPFLSETDLVNAMKECYALVFPSLFEGFGYPPVEAMKFSKPVLAANVTSMPEILGDAPIYFSPFYVTDIFSAFCKLREADYSAMANRSKKRYEIINARQRDDLSTLVKMICGE